ncbi:MAG: pyridoxal-phosphate dependent enzyme [Acidobacteria bacterium]|nr:pyridoxal-phosphate dependent enzyme [Acidobacteriota bacterium]
MRFIRNSQCGPVSLGDDRAFSFHSSLDGYQPTPLHQCQLDHLHFWAKDERVRMGLPAFKILGASYAVFRKLQSQGLPEGCSSFPEMAAWLQAPRPQLVTATDGNHGRAVAAVARWLGLQAHVFVPEGTADQRIDAISSEGAQVHVAPGNYEIAVQWASQRVSDHVWLIQDTAFEGYTQIPQWIAEGYSTMVAETRDQLGHRTPELIAVQVGVGTLAQAVVQLAAKYWPDARILGVEPERAPCLYASIQAGTRVQVDTKHTSMTGLNCGLLSANAWSTLRDGLHGSMLINEVEAERASRSMISMGLPTGASGVAGVAALQRIQNEFPDWLGTTNLVFLTESINESDEFKDL